MMNDEKINMSIEIIDKNLAKLIKKFAGLKGNNKELEEKIDILEKVEKEIYSGNVELAEKIIQKYKEGIL